MDRKRNRVVPVVAAIAIQLCLGTAYVRSIFQNGIAQSIFAGDNAAAGVVVFLAAGDADRGIHAGRKKCRTGMSRGSLSFSEDLS